MRTNIKTAVISTLSRVRRPRHRALAAVTLLLALAGCRGGGGGEKSNDTRCFRVTERGAESFLAVKTLAAADGGGAVLEALHYRTSGRPFACKAAAFTGPLGTLWAGMGVELASGECRPLSLFSMVAPSWPSVGAPQVGQRWTDAQRNTAYEVKEAGGESWTLLASNRMGAPSVTVSGRSGSIVGERAQAEGTTLSLADDCPSVGDLAVVTSGGNDGADLFQSLAADDSPPRKRAPSSTTGGSEADWQQTAGWLADLLSPLPCLLPKDERLFVSAATRLQTGPGDAQETARYADLRERATACAAPLQRLLARGADDAPGVAWRGPIFSLSRSGEPLLMPLASAAFLVQSEAEREGGGAAALAHCAQLVRVAAVASEHFQPGFGAERGAWAVAAVSGCLPAIAAAEPDALADVSRRLEPLDPAPWIHDLRGLMASVRAARAQGGTQTLAQRIRMPGNPGFVTAMGGYLSSDETTVRACIPAKRFAGPLPRAACLDATSPAQPDVGGGAANENPSPGMEALNGLGARTRQSAELERRAAPALELCAAQLPTGATPPTLQLRVDLGTGGDVDGVIQGEVSAAWQPFAACVTGALRSVRFGPAEPGSNHVVILRFQTK